MSYNCNSCHEDLDPSIAYKLFMPYGCDEGKKGKFSKRNKKRASPLENLTYQIYCRRCKDNVLQEGQYFCETSHLKENVCRSKNQYLVLSPNPEKDAYIKVNKILQDLRKVEEFDYNQIKKLFELINNAQIPEKDLLLFRIDFYNIAEILFSKTKFISLEKSKALKLLKKIKSKVIYEVRCIKILNSRDKFPQNEQFPIAWGYNIFDCDVEYKKEKNLFITLANFILENIEDFPNHCTICHMVKYLLDLQTEDMVELACFYLENFNSSLGSKKNQYLKIEGLKTFDISKLLSSKKSTEGLIFLFSEYSFYPKKLSDQKSRVVFKDEAKIKDFIIRALETKSPHAYMNIYYIIKTYTNLSFKNEIYVLLTKALYDKSIKYSLAFASFIDDIDLQKKIYDTIFEELLKDNKFMEAYNFIKKYFFYLNRKKLNDVFFTFYKNVFAKSPKIAISLLQLQDDLNFNEELINFLINKLLKINGFLLAAKLLKNAGLENKDLLIFNFLKELIDRYNQSSNGDIAEEIKLSFNSFFDYKFDFADESISRQFNSIKEEISRNKLTQFLLSPRAKG